jgi:TPR repeat protein
LLAVEQAEGWLYKGMKFLSEERVEEAQACFEKGLTLDPNHKSLLVECARLHMDSNSDPRNYPLAFAHFTRAAELGHSTAQLWLGYMYYSGEGVPRDVEQAFYWLLKATAQENCDEAGHWGAGEAQGMLKDLYSENPDLRSKHTPVGSGREQSG